MQLYLYRLNLNYRFVLPIQNKIMVVKKHNNAVDSFPAKTSSLHLSYLTQSTEEITELILAAENFEEVKVIISFMCLKLYRPEQVLKICEAFLSSNLLNDNIYEVELCITKLVTGAYKIVSYTPVYNQAEAADADEFFSTTYQLTHLAETTKMYNEYINRYNAIADKSKSIYVTALQEGRTMDERFYLAFFDYLIYQTDNNNNFINLVSLLVKHKRTFSFYPIDNEFKNIFKKCAYKLDNKSNNKIFDRLSNALLFIGSDSSPIVK